MSSQPQRKSLLDAVVTLLIVGASLYPLYKDDLARLRLWVDRTLSRRDSEAEALAQVQREISLMEHADGTS